MSKRFTLSDIAGTAAAKLASNAAHFSGESPRPSSTAQGWNGEKKGNSPEKKKPGNPESILQAACVVAFAGKYPELWRAKRLHAIPNGGHRTKAAAAAMQREGQMPGVWDMHLTIPRGRYAGLWIESKATTSLTDHQKAFQEAHKDDYSFAVIRTVDQFMEAIEQYLSLPAPLNSVNY